MTATLSIAATLVLVVASAAPVTLRQAAAPALEPSTTLFVTRSDDPYPSGCLHNDCSLREAILDANAAPETHTIVLDAATYTLTRGGGLEDAAWTGDLDITDDLTIVGAGSGTTFVDGNDIDRIFDVLPGATVEMRDLAIVNGLAAIPQYGPRTAGGGGVQNAGTLTLIDVLVQANRAGDDVGWPPGGHGGGLWNSGALTLENVVVRGNAAGIGKDPVTVDHNNPGGNGGGVYNTGTLAVSGGSIDLNAAGPGTEGGTDWADGYAGGAGGDGGGVWTSGTATITGATIQANLAGTGGLGGPGSSYSIGGEPGAGGDGGRGGGLFVGGGTLEVSSSTIEDNEGGNGGAYGYGTPPKPSGIGGDGGGIYVLSGSAIVDASTIDDNAVGMKGSAYWVEPEEATRNGYGAGIAVASTGTAELVNVTISGHTLPDLAEGGGIHSEGTLTARFVTLAYNDPYVMSGVTSIGASIIGDAGAIDESTFTSTGYNVVDRAWPAADPTDLTNATLDLGPLAENSTPRTYALGPSSDAIDAVPTAECSTATDARGVSRPQGAGCDAGAYESTYGVTIGEGDGVGLVDVASGRWYLRDPAGVVTSFLFGNPGDLPIAGDWDGDGIATPGLYRQSDGFFYARDSNTTGVADNECFAGNPEDIPIVGDWDGDGDDNLGIYRPSQQTFYLFTTTCTGSPMGAAQISFLFGNPGDTPVSGDWDADGITEIGLHRQTTGFFYWRNTLDTGVATDEIFFGDPADRFITGDWGTIDGIDTPAIYRPTDVTFYFRHTLTEGIADATIPWPGAGTAWLPVSGTFGLD